VLHYHLDYPAVGEAIDEDASGFISVHEINHFLKKNQGLSTPVWFAL
jgi:Zn-dependent M28 family amino/carboxypeptidase